MKHGNTSDLALNTNKLRITYENFYIKINIWEQLQVFQAAQTNFTSSQYRAKLPSAASVIFLWLWDNYLLPAWSREDLAIYSHHIYHGSGCYTACTLKGNSFLLHDFLNYFFKQKNLKAAINKLLRVKQVHLTEEFKQVHLTEKFKLYSFELISFPSSWDNGLKLNQRKKTYHRNNESL